MAPTPPKKEQAAQIASRFGENLRRARKEAGISQEALAGLASLHRTEIGLIERGQRVVRVDTLIRLASGLQVPPRVLLEGVAGPGDED
jgi:transcriptional regulator with XRE-family HTH domain